MAKSASTLAGSVYAGSGAAANAENPMDATRTATANRHIDRTMDGDSETGGGKGATDAPRQGKWGRRYFAPPNWRMQVACPHSFAVSGMALATGSLRHPTTGG